MTDRETKSTIQRVIDLYREGGSDVEVADLLNLSLKKFYELIDENDKFAEVVERGRTFAQAWWYRMGRQGLFMEKFNGSVYNFNMKNRYGWADKVETGDKAASMVVNADEAHDQLRKALSSLAKKNPDLLKQAIGEGND